MPHYRTEVIKIVSMLQEKGIIDSDISSLDGLVNNVAPALTTGINEKRLHSQVNFFVTTYGVDHTINTLKAKCFL